MSSEEESNRTTLPEAPADGADNFAAEPGEHWSTESENDVATRSELGTLTDNPSPSVEGDIGNRTGGEPPEDYADRRSERTSAVAGELSVLDDANEEQGSDEQ